MKHLPNALTLFRILVSGIFPAFFIREQYMACAILFGLSAISDILDGMIARGFGLVSDLGKLLDPLADKISLLVISVCFYSAGWIPGIMLAAVIVKELFMLLGAAIMLRSNSVAEADIFGKAATVTFNVSIALTLLARFPRIDFLGRLPIILFGLSILCSFLAMFHYFTTQFKASRI